MSSSKLLDQVRTTARLRHLSLKTEKAYVQQIKRFILFHGKQHPLEMAAGYISLASSRAFTFGHSDVMMLKQTESRMRPFGMIM